MLFFQGFRGFKVSELQSFNQSFKVPQFRSCQSVTISKLPRFKVTKFQRPRVSKLQNSKLSQCATLQSFTSLEFQLFLSRWERWLSNMIVFFRLWISRFPLLSDLGSFLYLRKTCIANKGRCHDICNNKNATPKHVVSRPVTSA